MRNLHEGVWQESMVVKSTLVYFGTKIHDTVYVRGLLTVIELKGYGFLQTHQAFVIEYLRDEPVCVLEYNKTDTSIS